LGKFPRANSPEINNTVPEGLLMADTPTAKPEQESLFPI
jgi:hypothetical protein